MGEVKELKRAGKLDKAEELLLNLIDAVEAEARVERCGVAPWYYEQLATIYKRRSEPSMELAILQRFARNAHGPGVMPSKLLAHLQKIRQGLLHG